MKCPDPAPFLFVDVEASSLQEGGFPIELAWVMDDGTHESHLIRPENGWRVWCARAARVHGLTPAVLQACGQPAAVVARRFVQVARGRRVVSDAVAFDAAWLSMLCTAANLATPALLPVQLAYAKAVAPLLDPAAPRPVQARMALDLVACHEHHENTRNRPRHRALPDAWSLWRTWRAIAGAPMLPDPVWPAAR